MILLWKANLKLKSPLLGRSLPYHLFAVVPVLYIHSDHCDLCTNTSEEAPAGLKSCRFNKTDDDQHGIELDLAATKSFLTTHMEENNAVSKLTVVCLLDPKPQSDHEWQSVAQGDGLGNLACLEEFEACLLGNQALSAGRACVVVVLVQWLGHARGVVLARQADLQCT